MGHQDRHLELRALTSDAGPAARNPRAFDAEEARPEAPIISMPRPHDDLENTPLALDHDAVPSWRETARFFRRAG